MPIRLRITQFPDQYSRPNRPIRAVPPRRLSAVLNIASISVTPSKQVSDLQVRSLTLIIRWVSDLPEDLNILQFSLTRHRAALFFFFIYNFTQHLFSRGIMWHFFLSLFITSHSCGIVRHLFLSLFITSHTAFILSRGNFLILFLIFLYFKLLLLRS